MQAYVHHASSTLLTNVCVYVYVCSSNINMYIIHLYKAKAYVHNASSALLTNVHVHFQCMYAYMYSSNTCTCTLMYKAKVYCTNSDTIT